MMRALRLAALACLTLACATTAVPKRDRLHVGLRYVGSRFALRQSLDVAPFFRDDSRRLLTPQPPSEVELMVTPRGEAISPGPRLEVLPAGTSVTVVEISFPTPLVAFGRPLFTPRERPWVELAVAGRSLPPTYVLTLRPNVATEEEVVEEIERLLTTNDVAAEVGSLSPADQEAIRTRVVQPGLSKRALELIFGSPLQQRIFGEGADVAEEWTWHTDLGPTRRVHLRNGVVERYEELIRSKATATAAPATASPVPASPVPAAAPATP
jgi:hypothetical protein